MTSARNLWIIVSPVFRPAPGGGAIYNDTIARALAAAGEDVLVIAEKHPGECARETFFEAAGRAEVFRYLPHRAGRAAKDWLSYLAYAQANLCYLRLPKIIRQETARHEPSAVAILLHSSLLYNPGLLDLLLPGLRPKNGVPAAMIVDVRDYQFPASKYHLLRHFDAVVTSSEGVARDLGRREPSIADRLMPIPMPFSGPTAPSSEVMDRVFSRYGLRPGRYLFNPNGIANSKHYPALRDAIPLLRQHRGFEDAILVTAGRDRDRTKLDDLSEAQGLTRYLGPLPHDEILALMKCALMTAILSNREAISRAALEAMWVGGRVLLPDLPEFQADCESHICSQATPGEIAKIVANLSRKEMPRFSFGKHDAEAFVPLYRRLMPTSQLEAPQHHRASESV